MKINSSTRIVGEKIILVPYREHHVPKYHEWMSSQEIQDLTASEPLSLLEEYEMCNKWKNDNDKLTFIILNKNCYETLDKSIDENEKEIKSMVGDVNLFVNENEIVNNDNLKVGELEIMIAEKANRGLGFGKEAIKLMIYYCMQNLNDVTTFIVKISENNLASIKMFEKNFGFSRYDHIKVFKQLCLILKIDDDYLSKISNDSSLIKFQKNYKLNINYNYCI
jgi:RimJ/RimL family protein N-acetyltransferase